MLKAMASSKGKPWTRDELLVAVNLYCRTPFGQIHIFNPDIIELANLIGRTPGSISYKLANFAHIDSTLPRQGASNTSKLDREIWEEFSADWTGMIAESRALLARLSPSLDPDKEESATSAKGKTKRVTTEVRMNQSFFRSMVLAAYDSSCCITGVTNSKLLIASHISPWATDEKNRMNPRNGLCLNALHDRAFDQGLLTFNEEYRVTLSKQVKHDLLIQFADKKIDLPSRFAPDQMLLKHHRENIFVP